MIRLSKKFIIYFNIIMMFIMIACILLISPYLFNTESPYGYLMILPIVYFIGYIIYVTICSNKIIDIKMIILFGFFIKLFLLPILVIYCGKFDISKMNFLLENKIINAVLIQILEWISVIFALVIINPKCESQDNDLFISNIDKKYNRKIWNVIILCGLILMVAFMVYPSLLNKFRPIFFTDQSKEIAWRRESVIAVNTISPYIYYPLNWLLSITRFSFIYFIIINIWKKRNSKNSGILCIVSFLTILICLVLIVPDDVAASILMAVSLLTLLTKLYPEKRKTIVRIILLFAGILFSYMFLIKPLTGQDNLLKSLAGLTGKLNAYFSGTINLSGALLMQANNKIEYFFGDFFRSIPVVKGFFVSMPRTTELFNSALGYDATYFSQIIPLEGQAYFYFGYLGVIFLPFITVKLCLYFYKKMLNSKSTYSYFIYCFYSLLFAMGIVMYDGFLIFDITLSYLPLLILNKLFVKRGHNL